MQFRIPCLLSLISALLFSTQAQSENFKVGDRVEVDVTNLGIWKPGEATEVLPYQRYRVQIDEEKGRYDPTVCLERNMRAGSSAPAARSNLQGAGTGAVTNAAAGAVPAKNQRAVSVQSHAAPSPASKPVQGQLPSTQSIGPGDDTSGLPRGLGTPPPGIYVAQKMSPGGGYLGLGELEIRGSTYRGLSGGSFAPFSISGGNIIWSAGIKGVPDGWVIRHSVYRGLDDSGHPYIQVFYRSKSGFNDCFDCVKEK